MSYRSEINRNYANIYRISETESGLVLCTNLGILACKEVYIPNDSDLALSNTDLAFASLVAGINVTSTPVDYLAYPSLEELLTKTCERLRRPTTSEIDFYIRLDQDDVPVPTVAEQQSIENFGASVVNSSISIEANSGAQRYDPSGPYL